MGWRGLIAVLLFGIFADSAHALILYRVSGISDFNLPSWKIGDPAVSTSIDICVYSALDDSYTVTAVAVPNYSLISGLNSLAYSLRWEDSGAGNLGNSSGTAMVNGVPLNSRQNANISLFSNDCSTGSPSGPTARLYLSISQAALIAAPAGTYSGLLTITVGPI